MKLPIIFFLFLTYPLFLFAQDGLLDDTFGEDGLAVLDLYPHAEQFQAMAVQADGKIVLGGAARPTGESLDLIALRLLPNGLIDSSFADNGVFLVENPLGDDIFYDLLLLGDGSILLCGSYWNGLDFLDVLVLKLSPDGIPDPDFGNNGQVVLDLDGFPDEAFTLTMLEDGDFLIGGISKNDVDSTQNLLLKLNPDGSLETSFGQNGILTWDECQFCFKVIRDLIELPDGSIIAAGYQNSEPGTDQVPALYKFYSDGTPDSDFGINGAIFLPNEGSFNCLLNLPDGSFYVGGYERTDDYDLLIQKYLSDGTLDTSFGDAGTLSFDTDLYESLNHLIELPNGKIMAVGDSGGFSLSEQYYLTIRMDPNGTLDPTWGGSGMIFSEIAATFDFARKIDIQPDGKILVAGDKAANMFPSGVVARFTNTFTVLAAAIINQPVCAEVPGSIEVISTQGTPPYQYSIDGGLNFQSDPLFEDLPPGNYQILVLDADENSAWINGVVLDSPPEFQITYTQDGNNITVMASGVPGPYTYSIDGGPPQGSPVFTDLLPGEHTISVLSADGCIGMLSLEIITGTSQLQSANDRFRIWPNPAAPTGNICYEISTKEVFRFRLFQAHGALITERNITVDNQCIMNLPLDPGLYFYVVETDEWMASGKLVIAH